MDIWALVSILAACTSVAAAVGIVLFSRRGVDGELKADVEELAILVERMGKAQRRERMQRVRQGAAGAETPLGASAEPQQPLDFPMDIKSRKEALRRKLRGNP